MHKSHTALDEPSRDEAACAVLLRRVFIDAVQFFCRRIFAGDVHRVGRGGLHAGGQFEAGDARLEIQLAWVRRAVFAVEAAEEVEVVALATAAQICRSLEVQDARLSRPHHGALIQARQPAGRPVPRPLDRQACGVAQHEVGRQVLALGAEAVGEPTAQRWPAAHGAAAVEGVNGLAVVVHAGVHAADEAKLIGNLAEAGQQFREVHAALSVPVEFPRTGQHLGAGPGCVVVLEFHRDIPAGPLVEHRLGVAQIHLAWPALHEQRDHRLGPRLVGGSLGQEVVGRELRLDRLGPQALPLQQPGQSHPADAHGVLRQKMPAT